MAWASRKGYNQQGEGHTLSLRSVELPEIKGDSFVMTLQPAVRSKFRVTVRIQDVPCEMEVDTGSALSIIADQTLQQICPKGWRHKLEPCEVFLKDFQGTQVPVLEMSTF